MSLAVFPGHDGSRQTKVGKGGSEHGERRVDGRRCPPRGGDPEAEEAEKLFRHLVVYGLVVLLLIGVWAVAGAGFFWPIFPIVVWGLAVIYHAWTVFRNDDEEARIRREMDRLKKRA